MGHAAPLSAAALPGKVAEPRRRGRATPNEIPLARRRPGGNGARQLVFCRSPLLRSISRHEPSRFGLRARGTVQDVIGIRHTLENKRLEYYFCARLSYHQSSIHDPFFGLRITASFCAGFAIPYEFCRNPSGHARRSYDRVTMPPPLPKGSPLYVLSAQSPHLPARAHAKQHWAYYPAA